jgi:hypothetical protein
MSAHFYCSPCMVPFGNAQAHWVGFGDTLNEAGLWSQAIDLTSVLVILCCSFGGGWRRWAGTACGAVSFALTCMYGMGL